MITSLLIHYDVSKQVTKPYYTMPKGVKVIFYDKLLKEIGNIVSDSAAYHDKEHITEFYKNVVATNAKGETYKSEELIWDQNKKIIYSNQPVQINTLEGDVINGVNFKSDERLTHTIINQSFGTFNVTETT